MLSESEVRQSNLIVNGKTEQFRAVGYDLTVGQIFVPGDASNKAGYMLVEQYDIPPQGLVLIFSSEKVSLPSNIVGEALPKTGLADQGVLVLNTGIVDPGYNGYLSGTTVNFSNSPFPLKKGDTFLRLIFEHIEQAKPPSSDASAPLPAPAPTLINATEDKLVKGIADSLKKNYTVKHRRAKGVKSPPSSSGGGNPTNTNDLTSYATYKIWKARSFPATFLNIPQTVTRVSNEIIAKEQNVLIKLLTVAGVFFAVITLSFTVLQLLPIVIPKTLPYPSQVRDAQIDQLIEENKKLANRLEKLEKSPANGSNARSGKNSGMDASGSQ